MHLARRIAEQRGCANLLCLGQRPKREDQGGKRAIERGFG
jgi:hypothetical protein